MVCHRCLLAVKQLMDQAGFPDAEVSLGSVVVGRNLSAGELSAIDLQLQDIGFERLDDQESVLIENIKRFIVILVQQQDNQLTGKLSDHLALEFAKDYGSLSELFSQTQGATIEQFYILQKIEKVKELLSYGEENLNQIADRLNYSSPSHLSRQFKSVTGMTPTEFRKTHRHLRIPLDKL